MTKRKEIDIEFIKEAYNNGQSYLSIAKILNIPHSTVTRIGKKAGLITRRNGPAKKIIINIGDQFGDLVVISDFIDDKRHTRYLCRCKCGNLTSAQAFELKHGRKWCYDCRSVGTGQRSWKGYGEISGQFWGKTIKSAHIRDIKFDITIQQGWDLFIKQNRKCALSGVNLIFTRSKIDRSNTTASLDRINSSIHYTIENVQWVHKTINIVKQSLSNEDFINWCKMVANYNQRN